MRFTQDEKKAIFVKFSDKKIESDTGSPTSQIALFTQRIQYLTAHIKINKKDHATRKSLIKLVNKRKKMLAYLKNKSTEKYSNIIQQLGLRK